VKTAMILAAGRGERLKPLTNQCPKSLCTIRSKPLIAYHLERLREAGIEQVIINHAWLGDQIRRYVGDGSAFDLQVRYSAEPPGGLETGGGLQHALPLLGDTPFICVNADIYCDFDFRLLQPLLPQQAAQLVLVPNPQHLQGDFGLESQRLVLSPQQYTYSGIAVYFPSVLAELPVGCYSIADILKQWIEAGRVNGTVHRGLWKDIGCRQRLEEAQEMVVQRSSLMAASIP